MKVNLGKKWDKDRYTYLEKRQYYKTMKKKIYRVQIGVDHVKSW